MDISKDFYSKKMDIKQDLLKKADKKALPADFYNDNILNLGFGLLAPNLKPEKYLEAALGWVYSCITVIADEIANIELHLYRRKGDKVEEIFDHPALDTLYRANSFTTKFDMFWMITQYLEAAGKAPLFIIKKGGIPYELLLLRPDRVSVKAGSGDQIIGGYVYRSVYGKNLVNIDIDEMIYLKYPSPLSIYEGKGTIEAAAKTIDIDNYSEDWNKNFFYNAAVPSAVLETEKVLTDAQRARLKKQIDQLYKGLSNAHKTMLLESGLSFKPLQISQKEMDFLEQMRFSRDKILGIFRVPRTAIGITDDVNRANAEATDYVFAKRTIKPKMQRIIDQFNEFFLPLYPDGKDLFLSFDNPVPEDVISKLTYYEKGFNNGWLTINEIRGQENLDDIGPAGDKHYLQAMLIPIDSENIEEENKGLRDYKKGILTKIKRRNCENIKDYFVNSLKDIVAEFAKQSIINSTKTIKTKKNKNEFVMDLTRKEAFWHEMIAKSEREELVLANSLKKNFKNQLKEILDKLGTKAINIDEILLDEETEAKVMVKLFSPIIEKIIKEHGQDALNLLGMSQQFKRTSEIIKYLEKKIFKFSFKTNEVTNDKLKNILALGIQEGEGVDKIGRDVKQLFSDFERYRVNRIARSETLRAVNFGTEQGYKQSGVVKGKEWLTAIDERTCEWCSKMDGKVIPIGDRFLDKNDNLEGDDEGVLENDYDNIEYPPLHPNCRCALVPVVGKSMKAENNSDKVEKMLIDIQKKIETKIDEVDKKTEDVKKNTDENLKNISKQIDKIISE